MADLAYGTRFLPFRYVSFEYSSPYGPDTLNYHRAMVNLAYVTRFQRRDMVVSIIPVHMSLFKFAHLNKLKKHKLKT